MFTFSGYPFINQGLSPRQGLNLGNLRKTVEDGDVGKTIETNYTRLKAHVNMWNKTDIRAVLLSCETSIAPFPRCLQNVVNISTIIVDLFV